jgi:hypothetical protein
MAQFVAAPLENSLEASFAVHTGLAPVSDRTDDAGFVALEWNCGCMTSRGQLP